MYLQHIELQYLRGLLAAQQAAQIGHCPALIAVHEFLDVCARLLTSYISLRLQDSHVSTLGTCVKSDPIWSGAALLVTSCEYQRHV